MSDISEGARVKVLTGPHADKKGYVKEKPNANPSGVYWLVKLDGAKHRRVIPKDQLEKI